jgi:hypothetical protein
VKQNRRRDVVRHVADERILIARNGAQVDGQDICFDDFDRRSIGKELAKNLGEGAVLFDLDQLAGARRKNLREASPPGSDLDDGLGAGELERIGDAFENASVGEEMLTEVLADGWEASQKQIPRGVYPEERTRRRARDDGVGVSS